MTTFLNRWGVGEIPTLARSSTSSSDTAPPLPKFGRTFPEKVGRPMKPPLLTQSGLRIRQIALAATHLAKISKHAPAVNSESRRGMSL
jgi:hypothetical protein